MEGGKSAVAPLENPSGLGRLTVAFAQDLEGEDLLVFVWLIGHTCEPHPRKGTCLGCISVLWAGDKAAVGTGSPFEGGITYRCQWFSRAQSQRPEDFSMHSRLPSDWMFRRSRLG